MRWPITAYIIALIGGTLLGLCIAGGHARSQTFGCLDLTGDGRVDILDLTQLASVYLQPSPPPIDDLNGDGTVNILDLTLLAQAFDTSCLPTPTPAPLATPTAAPAGDCTVADATFDADEQAMLDALNAQRFANGAPSLQLALVLESAATTHAENMAAWGNNGHGDLPEDRHFSQRMTDCGFPADDFAQVSGVEEVAFGGDGSAQPVLDAINTAEQQYGELPGVNEVGLRYAGIARQQGQDGWYWCVVLLSAAS